MTTTATGGGTAAPGPSKKRGPYAKTAALQRRILEAALEVFGAKGFRATTMKEVAERGGISERGIVHHFPTKENLLLRALEQYEEQGAAIHRAIGDDHVTTSLRAAAAHNRDNPHLVDLQLQLSAEATEPEHPAHEFFASRFRRLRWILSRELDPLKAEPVPAGTIPPERLAAMYVALLDGLQLQWLYQPDDVDVDACLADFLTLISLPEGTPSIEREHGIQPDDQVGGEN